MTGASGDSPPASRHGESAVVAGEQNAAAARPSSVENAAAMQSKTSPTGNAVGTEVSWFTEISNDPSAQSFVHVVVHLLCLAIYAIPVVFQDHPYGGGPTLDEIHIMNEGNRDVHGYYESEDTDTAFSLTREWNTIQQILQNDYWGRPMVSESSHRSWRPITVLSFRYLQGLYTASQLTTHRCINILTHAAAGHVVGLLAVRLAVPFFSDQVGTNRQRVFRQRALSFWILVWTKLVFCLHPTHVEVTANAANRNHILAVLCSVVLAVSGSSNSTPRSQSASADKTTANVHRFLPNTSLELPWYTLLAMIGFLCSETFLFQIPAIIVTVVVCQYHSSTSFLPATRPTADGHHPNGDTHLQQEQRLSETLHHVVRDLLLSTLKVLPRLVILVLITIVYITGRWAMDTLSIPEGLIRPAENPYFAFEGMHRARNYAYVILIHLGKAFGWDPVGFSHEYGFDCIPAVKDWSDPRFGSFHTICILGTLVVSIGVALAMPRKLLGLAAVHWAWMLTLLPVSGILKVGTFVSDRMAVPFSVIVCVWIGIALAFWMVQGYRAMPAKPLQLIVVGWLLVQSGIRVHTRTLQWMDSVSLLESSLETCPRFAKAHMEISKVYSGLVPQLYDLDKAQRHLETAHTIDPDSLCDVHQQFAHVAIQRGDFRKYEEELTQAMLCPFSIGGAMDMWKKYWDLATRSARSPEERQAVQDRQGHFLSIIHAKAAEQQELDARQARYEKSRRSPFA